MLTIEDKIATLRKRWFELHPTKPPAVEKSKSKTAGYYMTDLNGNEIDQFGNRILNWSDKKIQPATVKGKERNPTRRGPGETQDISQLLEDSIVRENLRRFVRGEYKRGTTNNSPYLLHLKNVEWVANIAVGIDKRFEAMEWWSVCPPVGVMISYVGATAKERAIAKANELKEYY